MQRAARDKAGDMCVAANATELLSQRRGDDAAAGQLSHAVQCRY